MVLKKGQLNAKQPEFQMSKIVRLIPQEIMIALERMVALIISRNQFYHMKASRTLLERTMQEALQLIVDLFD